MLHVEYTRQGGGTTYVYPTWRINEMAYSDDSPLEIGLYRWAERGSATTKAEAVREARRIARAEGHKVVVCTKEQQ